MHNCATARGVGPSLAARYGYITTTPKTAWRNVNVLRQLDVGVPTVFDTDVNAPAASELSAANRTAGNKLSSLASPRAGSER